MSVRAQALVWDADIKDATKKFVLLKLADYADDEGVCWPSNQTLQDYTGLSERQIRRDTSEMVRDGWIEVLKEGYSNGPGKPGAPRMIRLMLDVIAALPSIRTMRRERLAQLTPLSPQSPGYPQAVPSDGRVWHETTNDQGASDAHHPEAFTDYSSVISSSVPDVVSTSQSGSLTEIKEPPSFVGKMPLSPDSLLRLWNQYPFLKARAVHPGTPRAALVRAALAERPWSDEWSAIFDHMAASPWLQGNNGHAWKPDFDWILRPENVDKVLEGKYDARIMMPKDRAVQIADGMRSIIARQRGP